MSNETITSHILFQTLDLNDLHEINISFNSNMKRCSPGIKRLKKNSLDNLLPPKKSCFKDVPGNTPPSLIEQNGNTEHILNFFQEQGDKINTHSKASKVLPQAAAFVRQKFSIENALDDNCLKNNQSFVTIEVQEEQDVESSERLTSQLNEVSETKNLNQKSEIERLNDQDSQSSNLLLTDADLISREVYSDFYSKKRNIAIESPKDFISDEETRKLKNTKFNSNCFNSTRDSIISDQFNTNYYTRNGCTEFAVNSPEVGCNPQFGIDYVQAHGVTQRVNSPLRNETIQPDVNNPKVYGNTQLDTNYPIICESDKIIKNNLQENETIQIIANCIAESYSSSDFATKGTTPLSTNYFSVDPSASMQSSRNYSTIYNSSNLPLTGPQREQLNLTNISIANSKHQQIILQSESVVNYTDVSKQIYDNSTVIRSDNSRLLNTAVLSNNKFGYTNCGFLPNNLSEKSSPISEFNTLRPTISHTDNKISRTNSHTLNFGALSNQFVETAGKNIKFTPRIDSEQSQDIISEDHASVFPNLEILSELEFKKILDESLFGIINEEYIDPDILRKYISEGLNSKQKFTRITFNAIKDEIAHISKMSREYYNLLAFSDELKTTRISSVDCNLDHSATETICNVFEIMQAGLPSEMIRIRNCIELVIRSLLCIRPLRYTSVLRILTKLIKFCVCKIKTFGLMLFDVSQLYKRTLPTFYIYRTLRSLYISSIRTLYITNQRLQRLRQLQFKEQL